ncbi:MAG: hypothetical protein U5K75_09805 [Ahrensia sp.]|nr:hypothetical protein [Ahrensia sp.]
MSISGPFSTLERLPAVPRAAYWGAICVISFFANLIVALPAIGWLRNRNAARVVEVIVPSVLGSGPVAAVVWFINSFLASTSDPTIAAFFDIWIKCAPIAVSITISYLLFQGSHDRETQLTPAASSEAKFFARLPMTLGKNLYALQAQDHYVRVRRSVVITWSC